MEERPLYEETQEPPWPLTALGLGGTAAGVLASARALGLLARFGAAALVAGGVGVIARQFLVPMTTRVFPDEVQVRFGKRTRFRIPLRNVVRAYPRNYNALAEFGGWGIRYGISGRAFNIRGGEGVQLILKSGQRVLVGSQQPEALAKSIQTASGCETRPEP